MAPSLRDQLEVAPGTRASQRIVRVEITPVRYPVTACYRSPTGDHGPAGCAAVLLKIVADDGTHGWDQSLPDSRAGDEGIQMVTSALAEAPTAH